MIPERLFASHTSLRGGRTIGASRALVVLVCVLGAGGFVGTGCAASELDAAGGSSSGSGGAGGSGGIADAGRDNFVADVDVPDGGGTGAAGGAGQMGICGTGCLPDDPEACPMGTGGTGGSGFAGAPGSGGSGAMAGAAGAAMTSDAGAGDAGPQSDAGANDAGTQGDAGAAPESDERVAMACHVRRQGGGRVSRCEPAGSGERGDPCTSSGDCAPGFGCIASGNAGACLPYCCAGGEDCEQGSYCAERPLRDDVVPGVPDLRVPVCVAADNCKLGEEFPCEGSGCTCEPDETCTIVRPNGTTSCVVPGTGQAGQACPCAPGHVCSQGTNKCLKLCGINSAGDDCPNGACQAVDGFPQGYGVCVGSSPDAG